MRLTTHDVRRIRELRYGDGLTLRAVAQIVGCSSEAVRCYAPGRPGKVPNDKLRAAFLASGLTAGEVGRRMGWLCRACGDAARVKRSLGLLPSGNKRRNRAYTARNIDAETAALMAEAIGVMPWEIMPDDEQRVA